MPGRWGRIALRIATALTLLFIYVPLFVIALYAFNENRVPTWPPAGLTLDWWGRAFNSEEVRSALSLSIEVALGSTAIALVLGTLAAIAVQRYAFFGRETVSFLVKIGRAHV